MDWNGVPGTSGLGACRPVVAAVCCWMEGADIGIHPVGPGVLDMRCRARVFSGRRLIGKCGGSRRPHVGSLPRSAWATSNEGG